MSMLRVDTCARLIPSPWDDRWIARVDMSAGTGSPISPRLAIERTSGADVTVAAGVTTTVAFCGVLTNARELSDRSDATPAEIVRQVFDDSNVAGFARLRGSFAVLVWDRRADAVHVVKDQIGLQPLYYARPGGRWIFSASPDALVAQPGVSRAIDAVALSEWLCGWYPAIEDTGYREVKRVAPATLITITAEGVRTARYWDPWPAEGPIAWLGERDLEQVDALIAQAVRRSIDSAAPPAVFLSGGLDSIAVAVAAADAARIGAAPKPLALSLVFPDAASNEERIQAGVAQRLGLEQELVPFEQAVGPGGLVEAALDMTAGWPQPMWNIWAPAYADLARRAQTRGTRLILTGRGGDEWLTVTPYLLADLAARGDVTGAWRLLQARRRSHGLRGWRAQARFAWLTAARPLASATLDRVAPHWWHRRRRARLLRERPGWIAPDPVVRAGMDARIERWIEPARPPHGFYVREMRTALFHPAVAHDMEETQEFGRRFGQRVLHPFWDVDLVSALYRMPPALLMRDGRSKWLLRRTLAARLPGLGLEHRGKVSASGVFRHMLGREADQAWRRLGGLRALTSLGILSSTGVQWMGLSPSSIDALGGAGRVWSLLNLETWVRQRL
jgi:asparagine synthase (glutamine-hydrolysing)